MNLIQSGNEKYSKLLMTNKITETEYRFMKYVLHQTIEDGTLLCNTISGELVLLNNEEGKTVDDIARNDRTVFDELIKKRFLVPIDFNEKRFLQQMRMIYLKMNASHKITQYSILPTTTCNARCFYCYENDYPHITMSREVTDALIEFIAQNSDGEKIFINWFGGEPLVGKAHIRYICEELKKKDIKYKSDMISNGYLFTDELVEEAKALWNLKSIQITLDGTEEVYNEAKAYVGVKDNPFIRVINNIAALAENEIKVSIRMNMDFYNSEDLERLIGFLGEKFSNNKYVYAYVHVLFDGEGSNPVVHKEGDLQTLVARRVKLEELLEENGLLKPRDEQLPMMSVVYCMADNDNMIQCNPVGVIGRCEHHIFKHTVGDIYHGITNMSEVNEWKKSIVWEECEGCPLIPKCLHLKNCPTVDRDCFPFVRDKQIDYYTKLMVKLYQEWKDKRETEE